MSRKNDDHMVAKQTNEKVGPGSYLEVDHLASTRTLSTRGGVIGLERKFRDTNIKTSPGPNAYRPNEFSIRPDSV